MKRFTIIIILAVAATIVKGQIYDHNSFQRTFGSNALDEPINTFVYGGSTYVFGNTLSASSNNDVSTIYGGGDVFIARYDSAGALKSTKIIGGTSTDRLVKAISDSAGYWLFIQSYSGISGTRTIMQTCPSALGGNNDLYIVRLDKALNQKADYSCCMGTGIFSANSYTNSCLYLVSDVVKKPSGDLEILGQFKNGTAGEVIIGLVDCDSIGNIQTTRVVSATSNWFAQPTYTNQTKLIGNNLLVINDSMSYVIGTFAAVTGTVSNSYRNFGSIYLVNRNTGVVVKQKIFSSQYSESTAKTAMYWNGRLHVFIEDVPLATGPTDYNALFQSYYPSLYVKRTAPAKTISGKRDIWCVVLDSVTLNPIVQYAIGSPDDSEIKCSRLYEGGLYVGASTKGGVGIDKTTPNKGGFDYWVIKVNSNYTVTPIASEICTGGTGDDELNDLYLNNGTFMLSGRSKSGATGDKTEPSRDGSAVGDSWVAAYCKNPVVSFYPDHTIVNSGDIVYFTNTSKYAYYYSWDFQDGSSQGGTQFFSQADPAHFFYTPGNQSVMLYAYGINGCTAFHYGQNIINVNQPTVGIEEFKEGSYKISPNPFTEDFKIETRDELQQVQVYNSTGQQVFSESSSGVERTISLQLAPGIYYVRFKTAKSIFTKTLIKQ